MTHPNAANTILIFATARYESQCFNMPHDTSWHIIGRTQCSTFLIPMVDSTEKQQVCRVGFGYKFSQHSLMYLAEPPTIIINLEEKF